MHVSSPWVCWTCFWHGVTQLPSVAVTIRTFPLKSISVSAVLKITLGRVWVLYKLCKQAQHRLKPFWTEARAECCSLERVRSEALERGWANKLSACVWFSPAIGHTGFSTRKYFLCWIMTPVTMCYLYFVYFVIQIWKTNSTLRRARNKFIFFVLEELFSSILQHSPFSQTWLPHKGRRSRASRFLATFFPILFAFFCPVASSQVNMEWDWFAGQQAATWWK